MADEVDDALKFCEDETFWDLFDAAEKLEERKVLITCDAGRKEWNTASCSSFQSLTAS